MSIELTDNMPSPTWVDSDAELIQGLDLLGLRLPVQVLGNTLLDGVTTITPSVRYLSILCWTINVYGQAKQLDSWRDFREFAARVEAAVALGNMLVDYSVVGVIGSTEARSLAESNDDTLPLRRFVSQLATNIYANPSQQLGLTVSRDPSFPGLTRERGLPLANAVNVEVEKTRLGLELGKGQAPDFVLRDELAEFGEAVSFNGTFDLERERLIEALVPREPRWSERRRFQTYTCLLALADIHGSIPNESDLFHEAEASDRRVPEELEQILDGWLRYRVRDLVAYAHEVTMRELVLTLREESGRVGGAVKAESVIRRLMGFVGDQKEALRDLQLVGDDKEDIGTISFSVLNKRCLEACGPRFSRRGLNRGNGSLRESLIIDVARTAGAGVLALLPVSWCLATWRSEPWSDFSSESFEAGAAGRTRFGLFEVIRPSVNEFIEEEWLLKDVMVELAYRTANQHLDIAWSRMAMDHTRDVAVFLSDADTWHDRGKSFYADRSASRISQATNWLVQLELLQEESGLTERGRIVLDRCLETIQGWAPQ